MKAKYSHSIRYDMLCFEGIVINLNVFLGNIPMLNYKLATPAQGDIQTIEVHEEVSAKSKPVGNKLTNDRL